MKSRHLILSDHEESVGQGNRDRGGTKQLSAICGERNDELPSEHRENGTQRVTVNQVSGFLSGQKPEQQQQKTNYDESPREWFTPRCEGAKRRESKWGESNPASTVKVSRVIGQIKGQGDDPC